MKTKSIIQVAALLLLSTLNSQLSTCFAQGSLTPPGAPAPTMKSLDQIEARLIVNPANTPGDVTNTFIISAPGSYYLTGNLTGAPGKHGISIQANDVTLDLNGFALIGGGGGGLRGVNVPAVQKNLCVRNGTVRGWTDGGVRTDLATSTLAEKLRLSDNVGATGLNLGNGSAKDCVANRAAGSRKPETETGPHSTRPNTPHFQTGANNQQVHLFSMGFTGLKIQIVKLLRLAAVRSCLFSRISSCFCQIISTIQRHYEAGHRLF